jgi:hypothetical protein
VKDDGRPNAAASGTDNAKVIHHKD